ncbi:MAG: hypothetical protein V7634_84 [Bradyrhizobium sp.]|jgi:hypothetical protein
MANKRMTSVSDTRKDNDPAVRPRQDPVSAVKLSPQLTAEIDAWAEAHRITRADAIGQLLERGLRASPAVAARGQSPCDPTAIEQNAVSQIDRLLDPALPADERERRLRRLIEGPPEFCDTRIDLPKRPK